MTVSYEAELDGRVIRVAMTEVGVWHLSYILALESIEDEDGQMRDSYSIFAAVCREDGGESDSACVHDVTSVLDEAMQLFTLVSEGAVTPCTLRDAAEDFVASR